MNHIGYCLFPKNAVPYFKNANTTNQNAVIIRSNIVLKLILMNSDSTLVYLGSNKVAIREQMNIASLINYILCLEAVARLCL